MKIIILGCGTSTGVPVIGCGCEVCSSADPRNKRTRSSALIRTGSANILIDTSTDLRAQALANSVERIDAVLYTHAHADHIHGIDDLRVFNHIQGGVIPCYGNPRTMRSMRRAFDYIFRDGGGDGDGWKPKLTATEVEGPFEACGVEVEPVEVIHGRNRIYGYRFGRFAYVTDCSRIPPESAERLRGLKVLVLGALRYRPHPTHFNIPQALEAIEDLAPERTVLTHLGHNLDYTKANSELPEGVELAYDSMVIEA